MMIGLGSENAARQFKIRGVTDMPGTKNIRLDGRVALVTGAASGLGRAMAQALARHGAKVAFLDIDHTKAEMAARAVRGSKGAGEVLALGADITRSIGHSCAEVTKPLPMKATMKVPIAICRA